MLTRTASSMLLLYLLLYSSLMPARLTAATIEEEARRAEELYSDGRLEAAEVAWHGVLEAAIASPEREAFLPEAYLALERASELARETGRWGEMVGVLEKAAALEGSPAAQALASSARYLQGFAVAQSTGLGPLADLVWRDLGFLEGWRIVGSFDNERGGGFSTEYPPEKELKLDGVYDGKKRKVAWRPIPFRPVAGEVDLAALVDPAEEALAYAWTSLRANEPQDAQIWVSSDEGFRLWVNGRLLASRDVKRKGQFDLDGVAVRLERGWNTVLIKVTQTKGPWHFSVRAVAADGRPLRGVVEGFPAAGEAPVAPPEPGAELPSLVWGIEALASKRSSDRPTDAWSAYVLGNILLARSAHDENEHPDTETLKRAVQLEASWAPQHWRLAESYRRDSTVEAQREDNNWRTAMEKASALGCARADVALGEYYADTFASWTRAARFVARALERNPAFTKAILLEGKVGEGLDFPLAEERARERAWTAGERTVELIRSQASALLRRGKLGEAKELLTGILDRSAFDARARRELAWVSLQENDFDRALELLAGGAALSPFDAEWRDLRVSYLEGRDRLEDALGVLEEAIRIRPDDHALEDRSGRMLLRLGRPAEARSAFDRALALQPNLPQVREYVEFLDAAKVRFEDEFRRDAALIARKAWEAKTPNTAGDPTRILLESTAVEVNLDGTAKEFYQRVVHVLTDQGVRELNSYGAPYARGEQILDFKAAKVYRPDGSVADARLTRHGQGAERDPEGGTWSYGSVDLPSVSVDDVVEIQYVKEDTAQSFFGDYFDRREVFQADVPIVEKVLTLRAREERKLYFHRRLFDVEPTLEKLPGGRVAYTWVVRDVPKLDPEPAMPDAKEVSPMLEVSTFESWDAFSRWYWNLIRKQYEVSPEISRKVTELTSGMETDLQKIRAIYDFVVTEVRYNAWEFGVHGFKPYNAATIFSRRFGDCKDKATLICVMLKEAGIAAWPVLIYGDDRRGDEDLTLPMVDHFNHCIAYVPSSEGRRELYLDGTAQFHPMNTLPAMDYGAKVLVVRDDGGSIQTIPWNPPEDFAHTEEVTAELRVDLSAVLGVKGSPSGPYAVSVRQSFEIAAQRKTSLERAYGQRFAGAVVRTEEFSNLSKLDEPVSYSLGLEIPGFLTEAPEGLSLRAMEDLFNTGRSLQGIASLEKRERDVILGNPRRSQLRVTYILPAALKLKSLPLAQDVSSRFGRLKLNYSADEPGRIVVERWIEISAPRVSVADYAEFRDFAASLNRLESEKILLVRA